MFCASPETRGGIGRCLLSLNCRSFLPLGDRFGV